MENAATVNTSVMDSRLAAIEKWQAATSECLDNLFLILMGILIYLMQAGFAFLEAGAVRSKNTVNILIKNAMDSFFGGIAYWLVGYAFAFGKGNAFIGYMYFAHDGMPENKYAHWFFEFVFASTAATIISGAVAERCDFRAYMIYTTVITGFIYPVVCHWAWAEEGWLFKGGTYEFNGELIKISYQDFAGSGVVHVVGGLTSLVGAFVLGPRIGRFDSQTGNPVEIRGHSIPLASLGGFILVFGFFAFNGSSQGSISKAGDGATVALAVTNSVISASSAALMTLVLNKIKYFGDKKWGYMTTLNGCLTGMVAICAGCNQYHSYMAFATGILGSISYMSIAWLVLKLKIDDPLDAVAVHLGGGLVGVLTVPFFSRYYGIIYKWNLRSGYHLGWQLAGLASIVTWTTVLCVVLFNSMVKAGIFRVSFEFETKGLDIPKHGETAYPAEAYGHGWGDMGETAVGLMSTAVQSNALALVTHNANVELTESIHRTEHPEVDAHRKNTSKHLNLMQMNKANTFVNSAFDGPSSFKLDANEQSKHVNSAFDGPSSSYFM